MRGFKTIGRRTAIVGAVAALGGTLAACGSSSGNAVSNNAPANSGAGSGSLKGAGKQVVLFTVGVSQPYVVDLNNTIASVGEQLGFKMKVVRAPLDQAAQNQQVQQYLATGQKPAAFIWAAPNPAAGISSVRMMSRIAPVIQVNSKPVTPAEIQYVTAYAGQNDFGIGTNSGELAMQARAAIKRAGAKLHDPRGNLLIVAAFPGLTGADIRQQGFMAATKSAPFNVLATVPTNDFATAGAYAAASQVIPKYKPRGIDFVWALNEDEAIGVIKALRQNGLTPGKDVTVIAGDCSHAKGLSTLKDGSVYGLTLASSQVEGKLVMRTVAQIVATGKTTAGEVVEPQSGGGAPPLTATPPAKFTYVPVVKVTAKQGYSSQKVWGMPAPQMCQSS